MDAMILPASLQGFLVSNRWVITIVALGALVAVLGLWAFYRRRRKRKAAADASAESSIHRNALVNSWTAFRRGLGAEGRRHLNECQHFLIFGRADVNTDEFITNYTDWEQMSESGYASHTDDPNLRIYLGARKVILDLGASMLDDSSKAARRARAALWRRLYREQPPLVLIVLQAGTIQRIPAGQLQKFAVRINDNINQLSQISGKRVYAQIVLYGADRLQGFSELSHALLRHDANAEYRGHKIRLALNNDPSLGIREALERFRLYLPVVLYGDDQEPLAFGEDRFSSLPDFSAAIGFFRTAPDTWIPGVESLFQQICRPDELLIAPNVQSLLFVSSTLGDASDNPFELRDPQRRPPWLYRNRHNLAAAALFGLLTVPALVGFLAERKELAGDLQRLQDFELRAEFMRSFRRVDGLKDLYGSVPDCGLDVADRDQRRALGGVLDPNRVNRDRCTTARAETLAGFKRLIREEMLYQGLRVAADAGDPSRTLLLLSLLWAEHEEQLAAVIQAPEKISAWTDLRFLPEESGAMDGSGGAVRLSERTLSDDEIAIFLDLQPSAIRLPGFTFNNTELIAWEELLKRVDSAVSATQVSLHEVREIRSQATKLDNAALHLELVELLKGQSDLMVQLNQRNLNLQMLVGQAADSGSGVSAQLQDVIDVLRTTEPCSGEDRAIASLNKLLSLIDANCDIVRSTADAEVVLSRDFHFEPRRWEEVVQQASILDLLARFRDRVAESGRSPLVTAEEYPPVYMPTEHGGVNTGALVEGQYTLPAIQQEVLPTVAGLDERMAELKMSNATREPLRTYVNAAVQAYASEYGATWEAFFKEFRSANQATTDVEVRLGDYRSLYGALFRFLLLLEENTRPHFAGAQSDHAAVLMAAMEPFGPVNSLLGEPGNEYPSQGPISEYHAIVEELATQFSNYRADATFLVKDDLDDDLEFLERLSPSGRVTMSYLHDAENAYRTRVKAVLDAKGIRGFMQEPFLTPFDKIAEAGAVEIAELVQTGWNRTTQDLLDLMGMTPFRVSSTNRRELSVERFTEEFGPEGRFWTGFTKDIAPACELVGATWVARSRGGLSAAMPPGMLPMVNHLARIRTSLWDGDGNPVPITLSVKPAPFETPGGEDWYITDSYLFVGEQTVHGFNQNVAKPQEVSLEWWNQRSSKVSMVIRNRSRGGEIPLLIDGDGSDWAFLRLLDKAESVGSDWLWKDTWLAPDDARLREARVQFQITPDPRKIFQGG
jgi:hypothetical protein